MIRTHSKRTGLALLAAMFLASCGSTPGVRDELDATLSIVAAVRGAYFDSGERPDTSVITAGTPAQVRQVIAPIEGRLKSVIVLKTNESAVLFDGGRNGPYEYWASPSGQVVTLRNGLLVSTRGWGFDLMSTSADGSADLIRRRATGNTKKVVRFLSGEDDEIEVYGNCTVSPRGHENVVLPTGASRNTTKVRETCQFGNLTVNNFFWVTSGGHVVQSRQWASREIGELLIQDLRN